MSTFKTSRFDCLNEVVDSQKDNRKNRENKEKNPPFKEERNFFKNDSSGSRKNTERYQNRDSKDNKEKREQFDKLKKEKQERIKEEEKRCII